MTNKKKMFFALAGIMAVLAGLGLVVVSVAAPACEGDSNWFIKRQIVYLLLGVAGTIGAACVPWKVWLRAAPYLFAAVLFCLCLGFTRRTDVFTLGVPIIMLFVAWLKSKLKIGAMPLLATFYIGLVGFLAVTVLANPNRRERLKVWMGLVEEKAGSSVKPNWRATEQDQVCQAFSTSKWLGRSTEQNLPSGLTRGVLATSARSFGQVLPLAIVLLFVVAGSLAAWIGCRMNEPAKRLYSLQWAAWLCAPALYGLAMVYKLVPFVGPGVPLVSFGFATTLTDGIGLGILWATLAEEHGGKDDSCKDSKG